jgi:hypothetical protein
MSDIFAQYAGKVIEQYRKDAEEGKWVHGDVAIVVREIDRLREALREVARCDFQAWARNALEKDADAQKQTLERIAQYDMQKIAIDALEEGKE